MEVHRTFWCCLTGEEKLEGVTVLGRRCESVMSYVSLRKEGGNGGNVSCDWVWESLSISVNNLNWQSSKSAHTNQSGPLVQTRTPTPHTHGKMLRLDSFAKLRCAGRGADW